MEVALLGCAHIHTPGFVKMLKARAGVKVAGVWDHDAARAKKNADELGTSTVREVKALLDNKAVAAVVVCAETNRHEELVTAVVAAGKHLFVEKPLGFSGHDADRMAEAIEKAGLLFQTGYFLRGQPHYQFIKQQIDKGTFGKVSAVRHSNSHHGSIGGWFDGEWRWMADPRVAGCGAFGDVGTHGLDLLMWFMGPVERCTGDISVVTGRYGDCDENGEALLKFASGAVGSLAAGWVDLANPVTCIVSGTEAHAVVTGGKLYFKCEKVAGADGKSPWTDMPAVWPHAFENFLDAVEGKPHPPLVSPREAADRSAVMDTIYEAARQGRWLPPRKR
ncbi:MAG: Gfo/Idh/MocA family oxidoreductase [Phycisphaeraceae bacterium]|nr:Gfo/Idh/MocA family oxidoreductase [Phycisphaeraceae bacterium]